MQWFIMSAAIKVQIPADIISNFVRNNSFACDAIAIIFIEITDTRRIINYTYLECDGSCGLRVRHFATSLILVMTYSERVLHIHFSCRTEIIVMGSLGKELLNFDSFYILYINKKVLFYLGLISITYSKIIFYLNTINLLVF